MIELDELLGGTPSMSEVGEFFAEGDFCGEYRMVAAIKKHLLTETQDRDLSDAGITIEDALNGRIGDSTHDVIVDGMYDDWNKKLGRKAFGF
tara:strand:+ start:452 stop:727 length:276 start_codon:yes stop_codon:yes gene_type:complete